MDDADVPQGRAVRVTDNKELCRTRFRTQTPFNAQGRALVLLRHKRRRFDCRVQQGQRERFRAMATISLRRIVAIEFGM
jgi:hypothetical protein